MTRTKNLSREQLLTSFLHRACDLSSSGLQIDSEGYLYASGEMIAAWRGYGLGGTLFIDCGSSKVCNRRAANDLKELAEKEGVAYLCYNTHSYIISPEFQFAERLVSYAIWATPKVVNPENIFAQSKKLLDKAIEKAISFDSIQELITQTQHIATLFNFVFDATLYDIKRQQHNDKVSAVKAELIEYHRKEIERLLAS
jgi:DNA polymerase III alpha subunit